MRAVRSQHQLVALNGSLYALGGVRARTKKDLGYLVASVERYDLIENAWTSIARMANPRSLFGAAAMGGLLYVTGGLQDSAPKVKAKVLKSCERFDPATGKWSPIADLPSARFGHALACLCGVLYAVGGQETVVEGCIMSTSPPWRYDAAANAWVEAPLAAGSAAMRTGFADGSSWAAL